MPRKVFKILVVTAAVVMALGLGASSALATNWTSNGLKTFGASRGFTLFKFDTPASGGLGLVCSSAAASGTLAGPTGPDNTGAWNGVAALRPAFSSCSLGGVVWVANCGVAGMNASTHVGSVVGGTLTSFNCALATTTAVCGTVSSAGVVITVGVRVTGTMPVQYDNATDTLKVLSGTQGLTGTVSNLPGCNGLSGFSSGGAAPAHIGSAAGGVGDFSYAVINGPSVCSNLLGTSC